ncbi:MAG: N-formylglutamate amidohydrolase [Alphaproteobacteria bacterium]
MVLARASESWIDDDEPAPVTVVNGDGRGRALVVCDHASAVIPRRLGDLGLAAAERFRHIAWDIGAAAVARRLAAALDAPLALAGYSRLVIDLNRPLHVDDLCAARSEDTIVPRNIGLGDAEKAERIAAFYWPYHDTVHHMVDARVRADIVPVLISVHSFTPVYRGTSRPWHVGVNYRLDPRLARLVLGALRSESGLVVGENEPYEVTLDGDYTAPVHAERRGLPHVLFEIRQDLIEKESGAIAWGQRLAAALAPALDHPELVVLGDPAPDVREPRYEGGNP